MIGHGFHLAVDQARGADRGGPGPVRRTASKGHADADPSGVRGHRPAAAHAGRLRRARAARARGPLPGDDQPQRPRGRPGSTWSSSTRASKARPAAGPALRAPPTSSTRVTRYVGGESAEACHRLGGGGTGPRPRGRARQGGPADRGRADPAVLGADGPRPATRFGPRHPVAAGSLEGRRSRTWRTPDQPGRPSTRSKRDMERSAPMDRLICGGRRIRQDRGSRSAPRSRRSRTARQGRRGWWPTHACWPSSTTPRFSEPGSRPFPVTTAMLSRFSSDGEAAPYPGGTDRGQGGTWVVGTHRACCPRTPRFARLGLVIHRRGTAVSGWEHKEVPQADAQTEVDGAGHVGHADPAHAWRWAIAGIRGDVHHPLTPPEGAPSGAHPGSGAYDEKQIGRGHPAGRSCSAERPGSSSWHNRGELDQPGGTRGSASSSRRAPRRRSRTAR